MRGSTQVSKHRSHGTPGPKSPARRPTQRSTPARPLTRDLAGKYGDPAVSQVILRGSNSADGQNPPPGDSTLGTLSQDRSPRSESICPVERPSSCDTGHNARLATKGSVQQSPVNRPVYSEHAPVTPGPGKPGNGLSTGTRTRYSVPPTTPCKQGTVTTPGRPITPGSTVTPGDSVRPVNTGQKAQLEKTDQCLDQSELSVLNSPGRSVQLEHNVHEQPGDIPILQIEHLSENSQVFQDFTISDSPDVRADDSTELTHLQDSGLRAPVTPSTLWAPVTLVTVQTVSIQSADLGRLGLILWSMGQTELDIVLMSLVLHGEIVSHIVNLSPSITLT